MPNLNRRYSGRWPMLGAKPVCQNDDARRCHLWHEATVSPLAGCSRYWGNSRHGPSSRNRSKLTQLVTSTPPITALRKGQTTLTLTFADNEAVTGWIKGHSDGRKLFWRCVVERCSLVHNMDSRIF